MSSYKQCEGSKKAVPVVRLKGNGGESAKIPSPSYGTSPNSHKRGKQG